MVKVQFSQKNWLNQSYKKKHSLKHTVALYKYSILKSYIAIIFFHKLHCNEKSYEVKDVFF